MEAKVIVAKNVHFVVDRDDEPLEKLYAEHAATDGAARQLTPT
jgi:hypothetical protein